MNPQWYYLLAIVLSIYLSGLLYFFYYSKKRKVLEARLETTRAAIGMLVAEHNSDEGVSNAVFSATYALLAVHVGDQVAGVFNSFIRGTDDVFYFPEGTFNKFCNTVLDSGFKVRELLYHGDFAYFEKSLTEDF